MQHPPQIIMAPDDFQDDHLEPWVGIDEVAAHLAMSKSEARRLIRALDLPRWKWSHKVVRYRLSEIDRVLERLSQDY